MLITCAWCKKDMGEKPPLEDKSTTHGMCKECFDKEMKKETPKHCIHCHATEDLIFWCGIPVCNDFNACLDRMMHKLVSWSVAK